MCGTRGGVTRQSVTSNLITRIKYGTVPLAQVSMYHMAVGIRSTHICTYTELALHYSLTNAWKICAVDDSGTI